MNEMYCDSTNAILGNSVDVNLSHIEDAEIRADVVVKQINTRRVWGQIIDCEGVPMPNALVKLVKVIYHQDTVSYKGVAHTIADCQGFYQFDLCADDKSCYKILVNKSVTGGETIIDKRYNNCNPCQTCEGHRQERCVEYPPYEPYEMNGNTYVNNRRGYVPKSSECERQDETYPPYNDTETTYPARKMPVSRPRVNRPPRHNCNNY